MPWVLPRSWRVEFEGNLVALSRARAGDVEVAVNTSSGRCRRVAQKAACAAYSGNSGTTWICDEGDRIMGVCECVIL